MTNAATKRERVVDIINRLRLDKKTGKTLRYKKNCDSRLAAQTLNESYVGESTQPLAFGVEAGPY
jgi:hypothetical protein